MTRSLIRWLIVPLAGLAGVVSVGAAPAGQGAEPPYPPPVPVLTEGDYTVVPVAGKDLFGPAHIMPPEAATYGEVTAAFIQGPSCAVPPRCLRVEYRRLAPGDRQWAGLYLGRLIVDANGNPTDKPNWGEQEGLALKTASRIRLQLRADQDDTRVELRSGCIRAADKPFADSFCTHAVPGPAQVETVSRAWKEVSIPLEGQDLSNVIGALSIVLTSPGVIYIDDVWFE